MMIIYDN